MLPAARLEEHVIIYSHITSLTLTNIPDCYEWSPNGLAMRSYSTRHIYNLLRNEIPQVTWHKEIWFSGGIPKHKFLSWLIVQNSCPTKDKMLQWGLQTDGLCVLYQHHNKSRSHLYFECTYTWNVREPTAHRCQLAPTSN